MPKITRKIELLLDRTGLSKEEVDARWHTLNQINDNLYRVGNDLINKLYIRDEIDNILRLCNREYIDLRKQLKRKGLDEEIKAELERRMQEVNEKIDGYREEVIQRPLQSFAYSVVTGGEDTAVFGTGILDALKQNVYAHYNADTKEIRRGEKSISNYKKGMPIPFPIDNKSVRLYEKDGAFYLDWYRGIRFLLNFGRDSSNNHLIVKRCLGMSNDGVRYKVCSSALQLKKGKVFLLFVVDVPKESFRQKKDMVVGVDLGLNVPITVATNKTSDRKYIGNRETFLQQRMVFQRRFKALQHLQLTRGGRGRNHKLAPLERLRESERNWVRTQNHLFSKEVITFANKVMASTINMERLTGFGKAKTGEVNEDKKFILRNWSYFELQNLIEYKAKMANIKVQYVNPAFTSQTCSECGQIGERNSTHFQCKNPECKNFGKDIHADYNGARNIAKSNDILKE